MKEKQNIMKWMIIAIISGIFLAIKYFDYIVSDITHLFVYLGALGFSYLFVLICWEGWGE